MTLGRRQQERYDVLKATHRYPENLRTREKPESFFKDPFHSCNKKVTCNAQTTDLSCLPFLDRAQDPRKAGPAFEDLSVCGTHVPVFPGERPEEGRWEPWTHSGFSSPAASHGALPTTVMRSTCKGIRSCPAEGHLGHLQSSFIAP